MESTKERMVYIYLLNQKRKERAVKELVPDGDSGGKPGASGKSKSRGNKWTSLVLSNSFEVYTSFLRENDAKQVPKPSTMRILDSRSEGREFEKMQSIGRSLLLKLHNSSNFINQASSDNSKSPLQGSKKRTRDEEAVILKDAIEDSSKRQRIKHVVYKDTSTHQSPEKECDSKHMNFFSNVICVLGPISSEKKAKELVTLWKRKSRGKLPRMIYGSLLAKKDNYGYYVNWTTVYDKLDYGSVEITTQSVSKRDEGCTNQTHLKFKEKR